MARRPTDPILIVDDNAATRAALSSLLHLSGYTTVAAASAEAALDHLRAGRGACLVILDLALPGMDGAALRAALLADPGLADLPVVVYSARAHIPELPRVAAHLRKTTDPEVLLRVVERACRPRPPEAG